MCDYSLQGIRNRLAEQGETLVVHRFQTGSKGLASPESIQHVEGPKTWMATLKRLFAIHTEECAICIPDGAQLLLSGIPARLQRHYNLSATEPVIFRQLSADAATYRDAVEFANGAKVRLQELDEGQAVKVMALSSQEADTIDEVPRREEVGSRAWVTRYPW
jgi:hypothetical protein